MNDRPTIIPETYPALEAEQYRAAEDEHERQTEPPPGPPEVIWLTCPMPRPTLVPLPWGSR